MRFPVWKISLSLLTVVAITVTAPSSSASLMQISPQNAGDLEEAAAEARSSTAASNSTPTPNRPVLLKDLNHAPASLDRQSGTTSSTINVTGLFPPCWEFARNSDSDKLLLIEFQFIPDAPQGGVLKVPKTLGV